MLVNRQSRILVADDFAVVRMMLRRYLADLGIDDVDEAGDGGEAIHMIKEAQQIGRQYAVVFLDWSMPKLTGIDVLQECRRHEELKNIPIILVTAESERKQVMKALLQGVTDYVVKPFTQDIIRAKIEQVNKTAAAKKK